VKVLVFSEAALGDLTAIAEYGERHFGPVQSERYRDLLRSILEQMCAHPSRFSQVNEIREGYRRAVVGSHSIYFRIENSQILVVRILRSQALPESLDVDE